jgi:iron-sulfur cluster assembly protein
MIKISPTAAEQIRSAAQQSGVTDVVLRVAAKINPDGKYEYGFGFDERGPNDLYLVSEGIQVVMSPQTGELVEDALIDFAEIESGEFDFVFFNPNDPDHKAPKTE